MIVEIDYHTWNSVGGYAFPYACLIRWKLQILVSNFGKKGEFWHSADCYLEHFADYSQYIAVAAGSNKNCNYCY